MKTTCLNKTPLCRLPTGRLPILHLLLLALLLPARADDPVLNPNAPRDASLSLGATVTFQVSASTTNPPLTFQWQHGGTNLDGATLSSLRLTNLTDLDAGRYQAIVWNAGGDSATSRVATLRVDPTFTKITRGPVVEDLEPSVSGAWGDYDNDGRLDLFVANSAWNFGGHRNTLYHNLGGDEFIRVTNALTARVNTSWSGQWGDYDNDGDLDLLVVHPKSARDELFRNDGAGVFTPISNAATAIAAQHTDASWIDHDHDGWLDLFVTTQGSARDSFFHNLADGTFSAWTTNEVGLVVRDPTSTAGPAWCDVDADGDLDLYVSYYQGATNFLYRNDGGRLDQATAGSLPARRSTWAATWADFNNDGLFDLFTAGEGGTNLYHVNRGNWVFEDATVASGLAQAGNVFNGAAGDFDNDGDLDLYVPVYNGADVLYVNRGDGTFDRADVGSPLTEGSANSATWVDYNNDGFLDLFEACGDDSPALNLLYRNSLTQHGNTNHWLEVRLKGTVSNASAIGARIWVRATIGGKEMWQVRQLTSSFYGSASMDGFIVHFGLGDATSVELLRIEWPSGNVQELTSVALDQLRTVTEPALITPTRPSASLDGSVTLTRTAVTSATYQWQFNGVDLAGQTLRTLTLTNIVAEQEGRYSVVVSNASTLVTNYAYLHVDTTFTKITEGPVVTDRANFLLGTWADYDDDGLIDLLVPAGTDVLNQTPAFYHNLDGTNFVNLTTNEVGAVVSRRPYCYQGLWADFNNDGHLDLLEIGSPASGWGSSNRFFLGRPDHTLEWVTGDIGVNPPVGSWQCSLLDYDNDGWVDVYYTSGWVQAQSRDYLYRNRGDGTFVHAWSPTGPIVDTQYGCWSDYDNDGDLDLWLGVLGAPARFYRNNGDGTFSDNVASTVIPGAASWYGTWGDYDNDGYQDFLGVTALFHNERNGSLTNVARFPEGAGHWGDYDNDGDLDFVKGYWNQQPCRFYRNDGGGVFTLVDLGSPSHDLPANESLQTWGDYNNDGFLDLFVGTRGNPSGANFLYRNSGVAGGNTNHWLIVKPRGTTSNRSAIGAKLRVQATIRGTVTWQLREIQGNYFDDLRAHFGLGNAANATTLRIEWPSGTVQELTNIASDQILEVIEPRRPVLAFLDLSPSKVDGSLQADPGTSYVVEFSGDLASWTVLATVTTDASGEATWSDTSSPLATHRYYKASRSSP